MRSFIHKYCRFLLSWPRGFSGDRRGVVVVLVALAMPVLVGTMGLAAEASYWYKHQRGMQNAADAAVITSATNGNSNYASEAKAVATQYGFQNGSGNITVTATNPGTASGCTVNCYTVTVSDKVPLFLSRVIGYAGNATVGGKGMTAMAATSVATGGTGLPACIVALHPTTANAVQFADGIETTDCGIAANSTNAAAITVTNSAAINVGGIYTAGGYDGSGTSIPPKIQTSVKTHQAPIIDPFANLAISMPPGCGYTNMVYSDVKVTLSPGVYCGGIQAINTTTIDFLPGTYYLNGNTFGGDLFIDSQATITCKTCTGSNGVTFVMTTSSGIASKIGTVIIKGSAKVDLRAPTGGSSHYNGILFYQDPRASKAASFESGTNIKLAGVLYFPNSPITWSGNTTMTSPCMTVVGQTVNFSSGVNVKLQECNITDYRPYGGTPVALTN